MLSRDRLAPSLILLAALLLRAYHAGPLQSLQDKLFDQYQVRRPRAYREARVRVIDIDDESLKRLGQWPWPRLQMAKLISRLTELGVDTIGLDAVFSEPDRTSPEQILKIWPSTPALDALRRAAKTLPSHDHALAQEIAKSKVVTGFALSPEPNAAAPALKAQVAADENSVAALASYSGAVVDLPEIEKASAGNGDFGHVGENDGIARRVALLSRHGRTPYPSLGVEAVRVFLGAPRLTVTSRGGAAAGLAVGSRGVPMDSKGRLWLHYTTATEGRTISAWCLFDPAYKDDLRASLKGALAFVGSSATGLNADLVATPFNPATPGVEVHAQTAENILLQDFLLRPTWADALELSCLLALGMAMLLLTPLLGPLRGALAVLVASSAAFLLSWYLYAAHRLLLDPVTASATAAAIYLLSALIGFARSEAERRRLLMLDQVKDDFIATVSHDLRGPVGAMISWVDLLSQEKQGPLTDKQRRSLHVIKDSGRNLIAFVTNVLDAAKIKAGKMALSKQSLSTHELLAVPVELFGFSASARGISLQQQAQDDLPPVYGDRERLEQVLNNLISNAMKFTPAQGSITLDARAAEKGFVRFSVTDTGLGIGPEDLVKLFGRFEQVDPEAHRAMKATGTGLGLSICKNVVEAHGGRIWVESEKGKGSSFYFTIPTSPL